MTGTLTPTQSREEILAHFDAIRDGLKPNPRRMSNAYDELRAIAKGEGVSIMEALKIAEFSSTEEEMLWYYAAAGAMSDDGEEIFDA